MQDHYDFSQGKRGAIAKTTKEKITIRLDPEIIDWFKAQVEGGGNYQSLMNEVLKAHIKQQAEPLEDTLRRIIREEMQAGKVAAWMQQQTDLVKYEFDPANPPALTEKQQVELAALAALPDDAIDYSDLPAMSERDWQGVQIGRFYRPIKKQVTVRIDADVLAWLQASGVGLALKKLIGK